MPWDFQPGRVALPSLFLALGLCLSCRAFADVCFIGGDWTPERRSYLLTGDSLDGRFTARSRRRRSGRRVGRARTARTLALSTDWILDRLDRVSHDHLCRRILGLTAAMGGRSPVGSAGRFCPADQLADHLELRNVPLGRDRPLGRACQRLRGAAAHHLDRLGSRRVEIDRMDDGRLSPEPSRSGSPGSDPEVGLCGRFLWRIDVHRRNPTAADWHAEAGSSARAGIRPRGVRLCRDPRGGTTSSVWPARVATGRPALRMSRSVPLAASRSGAARFAAWRPPAGRALAGKPRASRRTSGPMRQDRCVRFGGPGGRP